MVDCSCAFFFFSLLCFAFLRILSNFHSVNARVFLLEGNRMDGETDGPTGYGKEGLMEE